MTGDDSWLMVIGRGAGGGGIFRNQEIGISNQAITIYELRITNDSVSR